MTADQLRDRLAVPVFHILVGRAQAAFPETSTPAQSSFVQVILTGQPVREEHRGRFPVTVHWRQWMEVVVPVLEDGRWANYLGGTGGEWTPYTPGVPTTPLGAGLYDGLVTELLSLIGDAIALSAAEAGYGEPGANPYGTGDC